MQRAMRILIGLAALPCALQAMAQQPYRYQAEAVAWVNEVGAGWRAYAFEEDFLQPPSAGCLSPTGPVTITLPGGGSMTVTRSDGCAITDGTSGGPVANARIPARGGTLSLTFAPPIRAFYGYVGSVASGETVTMRLVDSAGIEMSQLRSRPGPGGSPLSYGLGFVSARFVTEIEFTTSEAGPVELGTFVGLRPGETSLDSLGARCPADSDSYPGGALCDLAFAYELQPAREVERDARLWELLAVDARGYAFEKDFPRPDPAPDPLDCLSGPGAVPIAPFGGAETLAVERSDADCPVVAARSFEAADALIPRGETLSLRFSPPVRAFYGYYGSVATGERVRMRLIDDGGRQVGVFVTEPSADDVEAVGHGFVSPVPISAVEFSSSENGPSIFGAFGGQAEEPTLTDLGFRCPADSTYAGGARCDLALAYDAKAAAKVIADDRAPGRFFGRSVSLSGDRALVGTPGSSREAGSASVFERQASGQWREVATLTAADTGNFNFGRAVSLDGDRALVASTRGPARLFERRADGQWREAARLGISEFSRNPSVSISGDRALVGAPGSSPEGVSGAGSAYVFERQGDGQWQEVARLTAARPVDDDAFGSSVSLQGNRALVGASNGFGKPAQRTGEAYLFERQADGQWREAARLAAADAARADLFGSSVSLAGDLALVGAPGSDLGGLEDAGSAYVFARDASGQWGEAARLAAADAHADNGDEFGDSVSLEGNRALIGAIGQGAPPDDESGAAYLFERRPDGSWAVLARLTAADAEDEELFGDAVSLNGGRALIGASGDRDLGWGAGAAYLFDRLQAPDRSRLFDSGFERDPRR